MVLLQSFGPLRRLLLAGLWVLGRGLSVAASPGMVQGMGLLLLLHGWCVDVFVVELFDAKIDEVQVILLHKQVCVVQLLYDEHPPVEKRGHNQVLHVVQARNVLLLGGKGSADGNGNQRPPCPFERPGLIRCS